MSPSPPALRRRDFLALAARAAAVTGAAGVVGPALLEPSFLTAAVPIGLAAPPIITRAQWGADESRRRDLPIFHPIRKFVVHHTATANGEPDPAGRVRSIYGSHLNREDGGQWIDIGYNFVVDEQGRIFEGRYAREYAPGEAHDGEDRFLRGARGAHAGEWNGGTVGIAVIGTYGARRPTEATLNALADLMAWKCNRHGLHPVGLEPWSSTDGRTHLLPTIVGHRDVRATGCPGNGLYGALPELRQRVADRLVGAAAAARSSGPGGYAVVHATGDVTRLGVVTDHGNLSARGVDARVTGAMRVPGADAFWMTDDRGGVHGFGGAPLFGSLPGLRNAGASIGQADVSRIAARSAAGYWLLDRNGGVFAFGDAPFLGSVPGLRAAGVAIGEGEMVAIEPTPDGRGYWMLDRNGGVFAFGTARFQGSLPALVALGVVAPDIEATDLRSAPGGGYWVLDRRGGVFAFGGAPYHGSVPATGFVGDRAVRLVPTADGGGYLILSRDGGVMAFGNAVWHGYGPHVTSVDLLPSPP